MFPQKINFILILASQGHFGALLGHATKDGPEKVSGIHDDSPLQRGLTLRGGKIQIDPSGIQEIVVTPLPGPNAAMKKETLKK